MYYSSLVGFWVGAGGVEITGCGAVGDQCMARGVKVAVGEVMVDARCSGLDLSWWGRYDPQRV